MSQKTTWEELYEEYSFERGPGGLCYGEIRRICVEQIRKKETLNLPSEIFGFIEWNPDDLAQTVIADRLLGRGQIHYVFSAANDLAHARALLTNEVLFTLEDRRIPNQIDNVWSNLEPRLISVGWENNSSHARATDTSDDTLVRQLEREILNLKRLRNKGQLRHSPLFAGAVLDGLARTIISDYPEASKAAILAALRRALSKISPALSIRAVGNTQADFQEIAGDLGTSPEMSSDLERLEVLKQARQIIEIMGPEGIEMTYLIAAGATQQEIAAVLGVSRPTAVKRRELVEKKLLGIFADLEIENEQKLIVLKELFDMIGVGIEQGSVVR